jgi:hypothetical protein
MEPTVEMAKTKSSKSSHSPALHFRNASLLAECPQFAYVFEGMSNVSLLCEAYKKETAP